MTEICSVCGKLGAYHNPTEVEICSMGGKKLSDSLIINNKDEILIINDALYLYMDYLEKMNSNELLSSVKSIVRKLSDFEKQFTP